MSRRYERSLRRQQRDWEDLAALDPLWAILSDPERRGGRWELDAFFATGVADVARVLRVADELRRPSRRQAALDFGCGVGRVTRALASCFEEVLGVDISPLMVEQARELNAGVANARFAVNASADLAQLPSDSFDLVYSRIVLQHFRTTEEIRGFLREFLRVVRLDGLVVFQLPGAVPRRQRVHGRARLYGLLRGLGVPPRLLYGRLGLSPIRVLGLSPEDVRRVVAERGGVIARAEPDDAVQGLTSFQYYVHR